VLRVTADAILARAAGIRWPILTHCKRLPTAWFQRSAMGQSKSAAWVRIGWKSTRLFY